jgi:hypothetical protein
MFIQRPFWKKVAEASSRTNSNLLDVFKRLHDLHSPIEEVSFTVRHSGDGENGYYEINDFEHGIEFASCSRWEAWERILYLFDPFRGKIHEGVVL